MTLSPEKGMHTPSFSHKLGVYSLAEVLRYHRALYLHWRVRCEANSLTSLAGDRVHISGVSNSS